MKTPHPTGHAQEPSDTEVEALRQEVRELRTRLERLETLLEQEAGINRPPVPDPQPAAPGSERSDPDISTEAIADIRFGGALRFNGAHREFSRESSGRRGESGLDVFRLNVDGELSNLLISAEYRFYPYMDALHHGWIGYRFEDDSELQFGVHQVPFGLLRHTAGKSGMGIDRRRRAPGPRVRRIVHRSGTGSGLSDTGPDQALCEVVAHGRGCHPVTGDRQRGDVLGLQWSDRGCSGARRTTGNSLGPSDLVL